MTTPGAPSGLRILRHAGALDRRGDAATASFDEVKDWLRDGRILRHLLAHDRVTLDAYRIPLVNRPLATRLLMRALARREAILRDATGAALAVGPGELLRAAGRFLRDWRRAPALLSATRDALAALRARIPAWRATARRLDRSLPPLYLRTDMAFGHASGGSLGHIAGVLNHLDRHFAPPLLVSSDIIPTVRRDLRQVIVEPRGDFFDFDELPCLHYNFLVHPRAREIAARGCALVYQRYSLLNFAGLRLAAGAALPFALEYNGPEAWVARHWGRPLRHEALALEVEELNLRSADLVVVVSDPLREELERRGVDPGRILVNPNGVEPDRYRPDLDGSPVRRAHDLDARDLVFGFIGTFGPWHGAETLVEAFGRLLAGWPAGEPRPRLLMMGDGARAAACRELAARSGAGPAIVFAGTVPQAEGPRHLAACDILVAPHVPNPDGTRFFGSPTKLFEYMATGRGIVASDLDQIGELLEHDRTAWLVRPGDADDLKAGLLALARDPGLRARLGTAAREAALARHTWRDHTRRIVEKLEALLER